MKTIFVSRKIAVPAIAMASTLAIGCIGTSMTTSVFAKTALDSQQSAGKIQHVVYIIMDNVHQSDIAQMPHLMSFLHQGTLFTNDHTVLDSHTQDGMLSDMTGKYPSKTGVIDQGFFENGQPSSFAYWTTADADDKPHVTATPNWTAFNQHGWNVGAIGAPDMELESAKELNPSEINSTDTNARDYLGVAIHNTDGTSTIGSPNIPFLYSAPSWSDATKQLGGFPGWGDGSDLNWPLQATYEMQTHGVPVTFTYLHDAHEVNGKEALPGTYDSTILSYDEAMQQFFTNMNSAGMNPTNTLFVITTDEGDHLMPNGELTTNLKGWLANNSLNTEDENNLTIYGDSGALVYLKDNTLLPKTLASLTAVPGWNYIANPTELKALHMDAVSAPDRDPSFVLFSKPDVYYGTSGSTGWNYDAEYLWNHGTISPDILDIWSGMVGPGVKANQNSTQWLDHTDTMPTIYALLGYSLSNESFDGIPALSGFASPTYAQAAKTSKLLEEESVYKQLNAPVGRFGMATLNMSTEAAINATNSQGTALDTQIASLTEKRDTVAAALQADILKRFMNQPVSTQQLSEDLTQAQQILDSIAAYDVNY